MSCQIHLQNVDVGLPSGKKLFRVKNLQIPQGRHLLIQGRSGLGKTTFLHLIAGLFRPQQGSVQIAEKKLENLSDNERCDLRKKHIGVVFQKLNLLEHLTVAENIELVGKFSESLLESVQLQGRANELCSVLSLGEQQRVAVARVLAQKPEITLADEPTSSLDAENAHEVMKALKSVTQGRTLIVVSHDHRIEKYFDEVLDFSRFCE